MVNVGTLRDKIADDQGPEGATERQYTTLTAGHDGRASATFLPYRLDLWNISHMQLTTRHGTGVGRFVIKLIMEDGGVVAILRGDQVEPSLLRSSIWRIPPTDRSDEWQSTMFDVAQLAWPPTDSAGKEWRRPPMPIGRVREVRFELSGAAPGESVDIGALTAFRPSGNGEAPDASKLVAGRVTVEGLTPLSHARVEAVSDSGQKLETVTDQDGYYFFYDRPRKEKLSIKAFIEDRACYTAQGRWLQVLKNEAELDIETDACLE
jgi:hypothetical protein